jgi:hypothetical protein
VTKIIARAVTVAATAATLAVPMALAAPAAQAASTNPPALWYKTSGSPTDAEITAASTRYRVVILNPWETVAAHKLKALNPTITVLAYKCLSSTRSYSGAVVSGKDAAVLPTGVGYIEASSAHPDWFAVDTSGNRVQWNAYPGHWQMAVWNTGYQARWAANVAAEIGASEFDGVLADNALTRLRSSYSSATLAGAPTAADLRAGERGLIAAAAAKLHSVGKILVPNISEARLYAGLWNDWAVNLADGGMEENYAHWGTDPNDVGDYLWDWGSDGWSAVQAQMGGNGLNLAVTRSVDTDNRSYRYGLASFLVGGGGKGAFEAVDDYHKAPFRPEQSWNLGLATTGVGRVGAAYTRSFANGFAAVNPSSTATVTVPVPAGMTDVSGNTPSSVTLGPLSGAIFHGVAAPAAPLVKKWKHYAGTAPLAPTSGASVSTAGGTTTAVPSRATAPRSARLHDAAEQVPARSGSAAAGSRSTGTAGSAGSGSGSASAGSAGLAGSVGGALAGAAGSALDSAVDSVLTATRTPASRPLSGGLVPLALGLVLATGAALTRRRLAPTSA